MKKRGEIVYCNSSKISSLLDLSSIQIVNINQLIPSYLKSFHDQLMLEYLESGKLKMFDRVRDVFLISSMNFIVPVLMQIDNIFEFKNDFCLRVTLVRRKTMDNYILFNERGKVLTISRELFKMIAVGIN